MIKLIAYHDGSVVERTFDNFIDMYIGACVDDEYHRRKGQKLGFTKLIIVIKGDEKDEI